MMGLSLTTPNLSVNTFFTHHTPLPQVRTTLFTPQKITNIIRHTIGKIETTFLEIRLPQQITQQHRLIPQFQLVIVVLGGEKWKMPPTIILTIDHSKYWREVQGCLPPAK